MAKLHAPPALPMFVQDIQRQAHPNLAKEKFKWGLGGRVFVGRYDCFVGVGGG